MALSYRLRLDPIACDGRGVCADLLPERIELDDWGYPMIDPTPMTGVVLDHARRAVAVCPVLALRLEAAAAAVTVTARATGAPGR